MGKSYRELVDDAKTRIVEVDPVELQAELEDGEEVILIDVREHEEYRAEHIPGAVPISRGVLELKIREEMPDHEAAIVCYCGGGGRSALAADTLRIMGYVNVRSLKGGFKAWQANGFETASSAAA